MNGLILIVGGVAMCAATLGIGYAIAGPWPFKTTEQQDEQPDAYGQL